MATTTVLEGTAGTAERRAYSSSLNMAMFGRRISWAAIIAGVVATTFIQFLLSFLGTGVGANIIQSAENLDKTFGVGTIVWIFASTLISLYIGGWMAGRLSGVPRRLEGALHGFLTASLGTIVTVLVLTGAIGGAVGAAKNMQPSIAEAVSAEVQEATAPQVSQAAETAAPGVALAGYGAFLLLFLGCCSAMLGGLASAPSPIRVEERPKELFQG